MVYACSGERLHRSQSALFTEVACVIVGKTQYVETGGDIVVDVARR